MNAEWQKWIQVLHQPAEASVRLFCFPYAGSTTVVYRPWVDWLPPFVELMAIEYPGHGKRLREKPFHKIPDLVQPLTQAILPLLNRPYAFFGHSMGALVAYEVIRQLQQLGTALPIHLFVSGRSAPHIPETVEPPLYTLPDEEFKQKLREFNGTPEEILNHDELMELLLPILRCDFEACETYKHIPGDPLPIPISALGGLSDESVPPDHIRAWQSHTSKQFRFHFFPDGHFFIHSHLKEVVHIVVRELEQAVRCGIAG